MIMYQNKISLTPDDILKKDFKIDTRGYRLKEVDQFLDTIIEDYNQFANIINSLEKEKAELMNEMMELKQELRNLKLEQEVNKKEDNENYDISNVDIIKRISNLEKMVYELKQKEETK